jgi:hypothetical protein
MQDNGERGVPNHCCSVVGEEPPGSCGLAGHHGLLVLIENKDPLHAITSRRTIHFL